MFIGCYNRSVILTYVGVCASVVGMFMVENLGLAIICLIIAGICDMFDGRIARMCKRTDKEKEFGIQIDSLCDVISFLVFPTVILFEICAGNGSSIIVADKWDNIVVGLVSCLYVLAGVTRLAWFNITTDGNTKYYQGLPVTFIAIILPLIYLLLKDMSFFPTYALGVYLTTALLFVLNIKIEKPNTKDCICYLVIGIVLGTFLFLR